MKAQDLNSVQAIAATVHPEFPEEPSMFEERLRLHAPGCMVLESDGVMHGYLLSHPWVANDIPKLNQPLGELPTRPETYYLHDIALLPSARGQGAARHAVHLIAEHAAAIGLHTISLCAVNGAAAFWESVGFSAVDPGSRVNISKHYGPRAQFMCRRF